MGWKDEGGLPGGRGNYGSVTVEVGMLGGAKRGHIPRGLRVVWGWL